MMLIVKPGERDAIVQSLRAGVQLRLGRQYRQVERKR